MVLSIYGVQSLNAYTILRNKRKKTMGKQFTSEYQPEKNGRPKGSISLKNLIAKVWAEEITDDNGNPKIRALLSIKALIEKAEKGDVAAFKALAERFEGMPKQEIDQNMIYTKMPIIEINGKKAEFGIGD